MFRDALLVLGKDLRIEARAKVTLRQVAPFVVTVMVLFAFGLDRVLVRDANVADTVTDSVPAAYVVPGLIWLALLFALLLVVSRSVSIEEEDGAGDALRLSGLDPAGIFLGKAGAIVVQLVALELLLVLGSMLFFQARLHAPLLLLSATALATVGMAAVGTCYGAHRDAAPGMEYWRIAQFMMPIFGMSPPGGAFMGTPASLTAAVPMDDEHTLYVHFISERVTVLGHAL